MMLTVVYMNFFFGIVWSCALRTAGIYAYPRVEMTKKKIRKQDRKWNNDAIAQYLFLLNIQIIESPNNSRRYPTHIKVKKIKPSESCRNILM